MQYQAEILIPLFGILAGISVPIATFVWLYHDAQGKRDAVVEISKNLEDTEKLEELLQIFEERKKQPLDYRRNGVITIFVGIGLYMFGFLVIGRILEGVGAMIALFGVGTLIAGYLYPNTGKEITEAVQDFEEH
jgi:small-conductance mechanosensitive channel